MGAMDSDSCQRGCHVTLSFWLLSLDWPALRLLALGCVGLPMLIVVLTRVLAVFEWILTTTWTSNTPIVVLSSLVVLAVAGVAVAVSSPIKRTLQKEP